MLLLLSEEPGSDICSFSTVEDSSGRGRGKRSGDGGEFRILDVVDDDLEIVERAAAMLLLLFWPEMEAAAIATSRERVALMVVFVGWSVDVNLCLRGSDFF